MLRAACCVLADVVACPPPSPLGFFQSRAQPDLALRRSLKAICETSVNISFPARSALFCSAPPPLPFLSPPPSQEGQELLCFSDPASIADCSQVASVTFALLSPPAPILELRCRRPHFSCPYRILTLAPPPREICRPQPRASKAIWIDTLSSTLPPPATSTESMLPRIRRR